MAISRAICAGVQMPQPYAFVLASRGTRRKIAAAPSIFTVYRQCESVAGAAGSGTLAG